MTTETGQRAEQATLHLARWTCASGSNSRSRGAVVVESGDHRWQASAEGNGPVDALFRAVDNALRDVLSGHPRLVGYDVHALNEGSDSAANVTVKLAPPAGASGQRATGTYQGSSRDENIVAASVEAYLQALNELLAEEHWAGATDEAGNWRAAATSSGPRNEFDPTAGELDAEFWNK